MPNFQLLYNEHDVQDVINVLTFLDEFSTKFGVGPILLNVSTFDRAIRSCRQEFPHSQGVKKASAFKKVANFMIHLISERPIFDPFPGEKFGHELVSIKNHQNAIVAFEFAKVALHRATIKRKDRDVIIYNKIKVSKHSYIDIIDALVCVSHASHFKLLSVLLEQLVYKANPDCQYSCEC